MAVRFDFPKDEWGNYPVSSGKYEPSASEAMQARLLDRRATLLHAVLPIVCKRATSSLGQGCSEHPS